MKKQPSKLRRQRSYWRNKEIKSTETENKHLSCIGIDGKIDKTLVMKVIKQEHH